MARVEARATKGGNVPRELRPGEPTFGAQGPDGAAFAGWVLVQVWEPRTRSDGSANNGLVVQWSGDATLLFKRAGDELLKLQQTVKP